MKIRKAVIAAAGLGTRFLPITKTEAKEMLPMWNKPLIQYAVEEIAASGIRQIAIITAPGKHSMQEYFCRSAALEGLLRTRDTLAELDHLNMICRTCNIHYIYQQEQLGLGHAVATAKDFTGDEPFVLVLPDDIIRSELPATQQLIETFDRFGASIVAVERVPRERISGYGVITPRKVEDKIYEVLGLVEKPQAQNAPSDLGIVGRYILTADIFDALSRTPPGKGNEIQLTDALSIMLGQHRIIGCEFEGTRYDTGTPLGLLKASIDMALSDPKTAGELRGYLANRAFALETVSGGGQDENNRYGPGNGADAGNPACRQYV